MTSKLSKVATAFAFLTFAIAGCDNGARIAVSSPQDKVVAPAPGIYEEPATVVSYDVYA